MASDEKKCSATGCRRIGRVTVGGKPVCRAHVPSTLVSSKKKTVVIRAKDGDKEGQKAMKDLLSALSGTKVDW